MPPWSLISISDARADRLRTPVVMLVAGARNQHYLQLWRPAV
jgi:hypothetical protein